MLHLEPTDRETRVRLKVTDALCVGPPGNVFLFGGVGHAAAIAAMKRVVGRELIWSSAQFLSFARVDALLDIEVTVAAGGRNISHANAVARAGDEAVLTVSAAFGARPDQPAHQWMTPPPMPAPEDCLALPIWPKQGADFNERLELRLAPGGSGTRPRDGTIDREGNLRLWVRTVEDHPVDAMLLAIFGDFVPAGAAAAMGRMGGGNSLDNMLRLCAIVPTRWVLCDIHIAASERGFAHGEMRMFAENGTLLALAGQSLILRFLER